MAAFYREENIYNLLPSEVTEPIKTQRYVSTFRPLVKREIQEKKTAPCKTMGIPKLHVPTPRDFLRKHSKERKLPKRKRDPGSKRPAELHVPLRTDRPIMGIHSDKDYITTNVTEAIMAVAKKPLHACVDVRKGDKFLIDNSGLVKKYLKKKDFGVTPKYIKQLQKEAKAAQEETDACLKKALGQKALTRLTREERENVLEGLKHNWEEINQEFQSLSVVLDTVPRKLRKEKMEVQMRQLERDINVLEKHNMIYIANGLGGIQKSWL